MGPCASKSYLNSETSVKPNHGHGRTLLHRTGHTWESSDPRLSPYTRISRLCLRAAWPNFHRAESNEDHAYVAGVQTMEAQWLVGSPGWTLADWVCRATSHIQHGHTLDLITHCFLWPAHCFLFCHCQGIQLYPLSVSLFLLTHSHFQPYNACEREIILRRSNAVRLWQKPFIGESIRGGSERRRWEKERGGGNSPLSIMHAVRFLLLLFLYHTIPPFFFNFILTEADNRNSTYKSSIFIQGSTLQGALLRR